MTSFYHVCFAVPDLRRAMRDLTRSGGVAWHEPRQDRLADWEYSIVFTRGGPPFIELIQGPPGSPWDSSDGARFHHLGFWSTSVAAGARRLTRRGYPEHFSGCPYGRPFVYHRLDSVGGFVELVDLARQPSFLATWHPEGAEMSVVDEDAEAAAGEAAEQGKEND